MQALKFIIIGLALNLTVSACAIHKQVLPPYDEVLHYPLAYDIVYLRALEAVQKVPGWELNLTNKEDGTILVKNLNHKRFDDADKRFVTLLLAREQTKLTSLQLAPESRQVAGAEQLMQKINQSIKPDLA